MSNDVMDELKDIDKLLESITFRCPEYTKHQTDKLSPAWKKKLRALDGEETRKEAGQESSGETGVQKGPEEVGFPVTSKNRGELYGMGGVTPLGQPAHN